MVLHARRCHDPAQLLCFVSVHLRWGNAEAKRSLLALALSHAAPGARVVLGGDFNTEVPALADEVGSVLSGGRLRRLPSEAERDTALGGCPWVACGTRGSHVIDHLYVPPDLGLAPCVAACAVGPLPPPPWGPYGDGSGGVGDGSDHAWVMASLASRN